MRQPPTLREALQYLALRQERGAPSVGVTHFAYAVRYAFHAADDRSLCMPTRAMKGCAYPGCTALIARGRFCPEHQAAGGMSTDMDRGSAAARGYDARWRKLRDMFLARHPLCADLFGYHQRDKVTELATDVDHVLPKRAGGADSYDNLQALCHRCHSRKTALQSSGWGDAQKISSRVG